MTAGQATASVAADDDLGLVATRLVGARRVLVTGLVGASFDEACAACDLAEALGAAIDFGAGDLDRPCGPTIARTGRVTAAPEEMRTRADLVVAWGCDPAAIDPALGALIPPGAVVLRMPPPGLTSVQAARRLHHLLRVGPSPAAGAPSDDACAAAAAAIGTATCVAILFADDADPLGLDAWAVSCLVQEIAHEKPAFEIAPTAADQAAAAVCSWRYGAAGAIARADRDGGAFLPAEASAKRLIDRRETDCVLAVGRLSDAVERALAEAGSAVAVCRIAADEAALRRLRAEVAARALGAAS